MVAIVDDQDYEELSKHKWFASHGYAVRSAPKINGKRTGLIWMHREINKPGEGLSVDHIDGNPLNNTRTNLRSCTLAENQWNRKKPKNNTTGYKNISWHKKRQRFGVAYRLNGKVIWIGTYKTMDEAIVASKMIPKIRGEFDTNR